MFLILKYGIDKYIIEKQENFGIMNLMKKILKKL